MFLVKIASKLLMLNTLYFVFVSYGAQQNTGNFRTALILGDLRDKDLR